MSSSSHDQQQVSFKRLPNSLLMDTVNAGRAKVRCLYLKVARSYVRSWWLRRALPPGDLVAIDSLERANRTLLIERATNYGPIFKGLMEDSLAICVVGHELGRRLLKEHAASLQPVAIQIESMVPKGFMRQMDGECHRHYRRVLVQGVNTIDFQALAPSLNAIVSEGLAAYITQSDRQAGRDRWNDTLSSISTDMLIHAVFGLQPGTASFKELKAGYLRLGPHGVVWSIADRQVKAFGDLYRQLSSLMAGDEAVHPASLLAGIGNHDRNDETVLGNLIYMVELGRYDLRGLLRWISKYAAAHVAWIDRIADETASQDQGARTVAEAFVLETLRMDQSERLMRNVQKDFVFEGYLIPRGALLRVCMWEAHKDPEAFPRPFEFDPARHLGQASAGERFSPFGLDHHHCPFAGLSVQLAAAFLRVLAKTYTTTSRGGEPAVRGPYHWEPAPGFTVQITPRSGPAE
jgi:cytochrome P450